MVEALGLAGAAHLLMAPGVAHLDPETAVFEAMLKGWALQQRTRFLKPVTIESRLRLARRVAEFVNEYPWRWQCADVEAFIDSCRHRTVPIVVSTARLYETTLILATAGPQNAYTASGWRPRRCCTNGTPSCTSPTTREIRGVVR